MPPSPSLRRTFSSPSVRSSPYPAKLSASNSLNSQPALASRGGGSHRRSTGSETSNRRVLAEIDWWTVTEGQLNHDADASNTNVATFDAPVTDNVTFMPFTAEIEDTWFTGFSSSPETRRTFELPTAEMDALSLSGTRHSRQSSTESSPEMPMTPLDAPVADAGLASPGSWFLPPLKRSFTTPLILSSPDIYDIDLPDFDADYADYSISPLSSGTPILMN